MSTTTATYAIALGANVRGRHGSPERALRAALVAVGGVVAASPIVGTAPLGPSRRRYANAAALIESEEAPPALLARLKRIERAFARLKRIERAFGRRPGRVWGARALDLDILLWSGGPWAGPGLTIPHPAFRTRAFVIRPLSSIAPGWRDPLTGRTVRQLRALVDRPRPRA